MYRILTRIQGYSRTAKIHGELTIQNQASFNHVQQCPSTMVIYPAKCVYTCVCVYVYIYTYIINTYIIYYQYIYIYYKYIYIHASLHINIVTPMIRPFLQNLLRFEVPWQIGGSELPSGRQFDGGSSILRIHILLPVQGTCRV